MHGNARGLKATSSPAPANQTAHCSLLRWVRTVTARSEPMRRESQGRNVFSVKQARKPAEAVGLDIVSGYAGSWPRSVARW